MSTPQPLDDSAASGPLVYRHTLPVRVFHWINALCLLILLMSGLQIFNAHPVLYWSEWSDSEKAVIAFGAVENAKGEPRGVTVLFGYAFDTTGVLGRSTSKSGRLESRVFPSWATLPSDRWLAMARRWHLFFAWLLVINVVVYSAYALVSRHLQHNLLPRGAELKGVGRSILDHLRFRHVAEERYNVLQKLSYLVVIFGLIPLIVLTGMTMSPWLNAAFPWMLTLFDGRQAARTLHFAAAFALLTFTLVHLFMVLITRPLNSLNGMLTGWYRLREKENTDAK